MPFNKILKNKIISQLSINNSITLQKQTKKEDISKTYLTILTSYRTRQV